MSAKEGLPFWKISKFFHKIACYFPATFARDKEKEEKKTDELGKKKKVFWSITSELIASTKQKNGENEN